MSYPDDLRELVDAYLEDVRFAGPASADGLADAMRYSLLAGGKRIRPVLALATARALGQQPERLLPIASAIELIHTYSLIHDDLPAMDDDEMRRGRPTAHVEFGENVAILSGDGLFAEGINLICSRQEGEPRALLAALGRLAAATGLGGMVGGQYLDVTAEASSQEPSEEALLEIHSLKTGRLIEASVGVALDLAETEASARIPYERFARETGVLFQIVDDMLDVTGSDEALGKPSGSDERHGKLTYVSLYGLEEAGALAASAHQRALEALEEAAPATDDLQRVVDFIHERET